MRNFIVFKIFNSKINFPTKPVLKLVFEKLNGVQIFQVTFQFFLRHEQNYRHPLKSSSSSGRAPLKVFFSQFGQCYCDECVVACQNVFLGPTIHLPRPEYYFESHHSYSTNVLYYSFRIRVQKQQ